MQTSSCQKRESEGVGGASGGAQRAAARGAGERAGEREAETERHTDRERARAPRRQEITGGGCRLTQAPSVCVVSLDNWLSKRIKRQGKYSGEQDHSHTPIAYLHRQATHRKKQSTHTSPSTTLETDGQISHTPPPRPTSTHSSDFCPAHPLARHSLTSTHPITGHANVRSANSESCGLWLPFAPLFHLCLRLPSSPKP